MLILFIKTPIALANEGGVDGTKPSLDLLPVNESHDLEFLVLTVCCKTAKMSSLPEATNPNLTSPHESPPCLTPHKLKLKKQLSRSCPQTF